MQQQQQRPKRPQTTVLVGGSNGTKTLCAILGDKSNPANDGHVIRVVTRSAKQFTKSDGTPLQWRCNEQKVKSDIAPLTIFPSSIFTNWTTHLGAADSVLTYTDDEDEWMADGNGEFGDAFDRALSGRGTSDDGGVADCVILACPVYAHMPILRRIARSLYRLDRKGHLLSSPNSGGNAPPLLIGSLYAAGGFDWQSRMAFCKERPPDFCGTWKRDLALFGLKAFPYLTKSTEPGVVNLFGRYPDVLVALSPPTPRARARARTVLDRVLQTHATNKQIDFLGVGSEQTIGGDGSASVVDAAAAVAVAKIMSSGGQTKKADNTTTSLAGATIGRRPPPAAASSSSSSSSVPMLQQKDILPSDIFAKPMADHSDPTGSIAFLTCTMNATNQFLHPCIMVGLFHDPKNPERSDRDGTIEWDKTKEKTPLPRFYSDGASRPESARLIVSTSSCESYPVLDCLDICLSPSGMKIISQQHGGEPVGRWILNTLGNSPQEVGTRSGLTEGLLKRAQEAASIGSNALTNDNTTTSKNDNTASLSNNDRINYFSAFSWMMRFGLSHNYRIGSVLSPAERIVDKNGNPTKFIRPIPTTRFFLDDLNHGMCILLGLGEIFGFDLERDMPDTLLVVRKMQRWMGKEFVLTKEEAQKRNTKKLVSLARDLGETSAPQAFGVRTVQELRDFLSLSPFGEDVRIMAEERVRNSPLRQFELRSKL